MRKIVPCLWFDSEAEEAARFYASIFRDSKLGGMTRYGKEGHAIHGQPEGKVMTVDFQIEGQDFVALNGGPLFKFNEAVSFQILCDSQEEIDYYWERLSEGGDPKAQQCGWLKDKFGLSWQIVPVIVFELMKDPKKSGAVMEAILEMTKLDIETLRRAASV